MVYRCKMAFPEDALLTEQGMEALALNLNTRQRGNLQPMTSTHHPPTVHMLFRNAPKTEIFDALGWYRVVQEWDGMEK